MGWDRLKANYVLISGDSITSQNGRFTLILQNDGNLVLYFSGRALWASGTNGKIIDGLFMQTDGNLVLYDIAFNAIWSSGTNGHPGAWAIMQNDGNFVIYDKDGTPLWASDTSGVNVGVEWTNKFSSTCTQNQLANNNGDSEGFGQAMAIMGNYWVFDHGDDDAWERDWRDPSWGGDSLNIQRGSESVDFAYLSTHGLSNGNFFSAAFSAMHDYCLWDSYSSALGSGSLKWVVFDTCESLQLPSPWNEWMGGIDGIHLIFGFTDNASDTSGRGYGFGQAAGLGDILFASWLDNAYSWWNCDHPVVLAPGRNEGDAQNRLFNETVYSGFDSIPSNEVTYFWAEWES